MKKNLLLCFSLLLMLFCGCSRKAAPSGKITFTGDRAITIKNNGNVLGKLPFSAKVKPGIYLFSFESPRFRTLWKRVEISDRGDQKIEIAPPLKSASVLVESIPEGAELVIDGKSYGTTPCILRDLPIGKYRAELSLSGYSKAIQELELADERPKYCKVNLSSSFGKCMIDSNPRGARVFIEGRQVGRTPYASDRAEGQYRIKIEKAGYSIVEQSILIERGKQFHRVFPLQPMPATVNFNTTPGGAEVYLNGKKYGVTPCKLKDFTPGKYQLKIVHPGFDPLEKKLSIAAGSTETFSYELASSTGSVELLVKPAGVTVLLNGKLIGTTQLREGSLLDTQPLLVPRLPPGDYVLTVRHPRAEPVEQKIRFHIAKGSRTTPKPVELWVANCELQYTDGRVERGVLHQQNDDYIIFGPMPGVKSQLNCRQLKWIRRFDADGKPGKKELLNP